MLNKALLNVSSILKKKYTRNIPPSNRNSVEIGGYLGLGKAFWVIEYPVILDLTSLL